MIFQENKASVNGKIWQQKISNEHDVLEISRSLGISDFLAKILLSRIDSMDQALDFISPKLKNLLPDPFHLLDMKKAVERAIQAILNNQKICIFADYDVDGATSSSLLKNIFRDLGQVVDIYVPDRIAEGYGPSVYAMQKIKDNGTCLLITVDCGAMAYEALTYAKEVGLDVIVIDHHISSDNLPEAVAVVNPNRIDETSEYKYLAAVGVSFLFATALLSDLRKQGFFNDKIPPDLMQYLDLVALGTVCDVMKLVKLNRAFVAQGLKIMQQRRNLGIKILSDTAGLNEKPNCYHLGFILGPRINAGGRVGKSSLGANLLSTTCIREANKLAFELEKHNNERKVLELAMIEEAIEMAKSQENDSFLFIVGKNWHPGVIGIAAGRLKEKFNKPVAVIALNDSIGKASCRSVKNIDFGSKILNAKNMDLLVAGGGHAMAAGFTVLEEKLQELQQFLNNAFAEDLKNNLELNQEEYDLDLTTSSINLQLMEELAKLEPFGQGNPEPLFKFEDLWVLKADIVGSKHIRCLLAPSKSAFGSKTINAIAFNAVSTPLENILLNIKSYTLSVIGALKINSWQERHTIQLQIKDLIV
ncbi:MAG: single-stranded-DNA-specific exonuclease RecJ [Candidatus Rickettsia vulgarisii]